MARCGASTLGATPASEARGSGPVAKSGDWDADLEVSRALEGPTAVPWRRVCIPWAPGVRAFTREGPVEGFCNGGCTPLRAIAAWAYDSWRAAVLAVGLASEVASGLGFVAAPFVGPAL